jgi:hypothetical protein
VLKGVSIVDEALDDVAEVGRAAGLCLPRESHYKLNTKFIPRAGNKRIPISVPRPLFFLWRNSTIKAYIELD